MQRLTLAGTDIETSVLGFGTAQLMTRLSRRESLRLLNAALDAGITHIDTAPLYGYGEAERVVGDLISGRRQAMTVVTKFGIVPPKRSPLLQTAKSLARIVTRLNPAWRTRLRARAQGMVTPGRFSVADARRSLETSLKELQTDYVDLLLLHECRVADLAGADELRDFLDAAVASGMIRAYGMATDAGTVETAARAFPWCARVVQFPSDAANGHAARLVRPGTAAITHSPFGSLLRPLGDRLAADEDLADRWSAALGEDCRRPGMLARLLLDAARAANPEGVVIFASTDARRIRDNAAAGAASVSRLSRVAALGRLLAELPSTHPAEPAVVSG